MQDNCDTSGDKIPENKKHHHSGKSSESHLDKTLILETLNIQAGQTILDAGCGNGYMSKAFTEKVGPTGKVYALDPHRESIETLQAETQGPHIEAMVGDITQPTSFPSSSMNLVYLSNVIHGFTPQEMQGFIKEIQRIMKPKGRLAIVEIDKKDTPFGPPMDIRISPDELKKRIPMTPLGTTRAGEFFYLQLFQNQGIPSD